MGWKEVAFYLAAALFLVLALELAGQERIGLALLAGSTALTIAHYHGEYRVTRRLSEHA